MRRRKDTDKLWEDYARTGSVEHRNETPIASAA